MSNYYLCDTCGEVIVDEYFNTCECWTCRCRPYFGEHQKLGISDNQTPHEVCRHWKPRE